MPIVTRPGNGDPLSQGDILKGLPFVFIDENGGLKSQSTSFLLVVSRDCSAIRDERVTVAPISKWGLDLKAMIATAANPDPSMDRIRRLLAGTRDGGQQLLVDRFYLGCLDDGSSHRFAADLSSLATLEVPKEVAPRQAWVSKHRVWRVTSDFARDLQVRLFNCFAKMGFDDDSWFCEPDLELLINEGELQRSKAETSALESERAIKDRESRNEAVPAKISQELADRRQRLAAIDVELNRYKEELKKRRPE